MPQYKDEIYGDCVEQHKRLVSPSRVQRIDLSDQEQEGNNRPL